MINRANSFKVQYRKEFEQDWKELNFYASQSEWSSAALAEVILTYAYDHTSDPVDVVIEIKRGVEIKKYLVKPHIDVTWHATELKN